MEGVEGRGSWRVETSFLATRIPPQLTTNEILSKKKKFLFLGDSVPFGWGVNTDESLPYLFADVHKDFIVINGAIPSYSSAQKVLRLETEFAALTNISHTYLQIYDPVSQYVLYGSRWSEDDNWTTEPTKRRELCGIGGENLILGHSNFLGGPEHCLSKNQYKLPTGTECRFRPTICLTH